MPGDEAVRIDVTLEDVQAEKSLDTLKKKSSRTFRGFEKDARKGERAAKKFGGAMSSMKRTIIGLTAGLGAMALGGKAVTNFLAQEKAVVSLDAALIAQGNTLPWVRKEMEDYAAALQNMTVHGDEAILQGMALATSLGATTEQAKEMSAAAADLSVAVNQDYATSMRMLAETLGGQARSIGMKLPAARTLSEEQLKAGDIVKLVQDSFGGMAEKMAESGGGRLQQVLNKLGDDLEPVGGVLVGALAFLGRGVAATADIIDKIGKGLFGESDGDKLIREAEARRAMAPGEYEANRLEREWERESQERKVNEENARKRALTAVQTQLGSAGLSLLSEDASMEVVNDISKLLKAAGGGTLAGLLFSPEQKLQAQIDQINARYNLAFDRAPGNVDGGMQISGLANRQAEIDAARESAGFGPTQLPETVVTPWEDTHPKTAEFSENLANDVEMSLGSAIRRAMTGDAKGAIEGFAMMLGNAVMDSLAAALAKTLMEGLGMGEGAGGLFGLAKILGGGAGEGGDAPVDAETTAGAGTAVA